LKRDVGRSVRVDSQRERFMAFVHRAQHSAGKRGLADLACPGCEICDAIIGLNVKPRVQRNKR
jgi:hypothetical protein